MAHTCVADALLAGDSRSLARNVDDIYREGTSSLVRAQLTGELLLPDDGLIRFEATRHRDGLWSDESSRLGYEYVARLYFRNRKEDQPPKAKHVRRNGFNLHRLECCGWR